MLNKNKEASQLDSLFDDLWPLTRSITGPGLRRSLQILKNMIPLDIEGVESGTQIFDWKIPKEWRIQDATLRGPDGEIYADYKRHNLEVVNYSNPIDETASLKSLKPHLHTHPTLPDATPYVTSYYDDHWGFCLPHSEYEHLPEGEYDASIESEFVDGELNYGHTTLEGQSDEEFLFSTYLCHPSMANNELSGPLVMAALYNRIAEWDSRRFTYRFVVVPETIGSLAYLSRYGDELQRNLVGGLVLTCLGGPNDHLSYKTTRQRDALIDQTVRNLANQSTLKFEERPFTPTGGSDERQYCSPGFDLPVGQLARTVYNQYDEYHTSFDDKSFMGIENLVDSVDIIEKVTKTFEYSGYYESQNLHGEPMLSKRNLYTSINSPATWSDSTDTIQNDEREFVDKVLVVMNYSDGVHSAVEIADHHGWSVTKLIPVVERLQQNDLIRPIENYGQHGRSIFSG